MAILALTSDQLVEGYRKTPVDSHAKFRMHYFSVAALAVLGDIGTTIDLAILPPGRVRVVPHLCRLTASAFGAARTLAIGHRAYSARDNESAVIEALNASAFAAALDVSAAVAAIPFSTVLKYDLYSKGGVTIHATVAGGTIPAGATLSGYVTYLYE